MEELNLKFFAIEHLEDNSGEHVNFYGDGGGGFFGMAPKDS